MLRGDAHPRVLQDRGVWRAALLRHPMERAESAFFSKASWRAVETGADQTLALFNQTRAVPNRKRAVPNRKRTVPNRTRALLKRTRAISNRTRPFFNQNTDIFLSNTDTLQSKRAPSNQKRSVFNQVSCLGVGDAADHTRLVRKSIRQV